MRLRPSLVLTLIFAACAVPSDEVDDTGTACQELSARLEECFGTPVTDCSSELLAVARGRSCEQLAALADPAPKADGSIFCPKWMWWKCAGDMSVACPEAPPASAYKTLSATEQLEYHWAWMSCSEYEPADRPPLGDSFWKLLVNSTKGFLSSALSMERSFTNSTDELDRGRVKVLHPYGSAVQLAFKANSDGKCDEEYSGLFAEQSFTALARLGWGADPRVAGHIPGIALKVFVEGSPSVNFHLVHSLEGDDTWNFFEKTLSNAIRRPNGPLGPVVDAMGLLVDDPLRMHLEHAASITLDGDAVPGSIVEAPKKLELVPTQAAWDAYAAGADEEGDGTPDHEFREAFDAIPQGTPLFNVYATSFDGCRSRLGTFRTTSRFIASEWGDERLQFQHATEGQGL